MSISVEQLKNLPLFLDGSGGSVWKALCPGVEWERLLRGEQNGAELFVRATDVLALVLASMPKTFPNEN